jgi:hypothetical protein
VFEFLYYIDYYIRRPINYGELSLKWYFVLEFLYYIDYYILRPINYVELSFKWYFVLEFLYYIDYYIRRNRQNKLQDYLYCQEWKTSNTKYHFNDSSA